MPRTIRDALKRYIAQSISHLAGAGLDLMNVYEPYLQQHPERAAQLEAIITNIEVIRQQILAFAKQEWEIDEDGLRGYL